MPLQEPDAKLPPKFKLYGPEDLKRLGLPLETIVITNASRKSSGEPRANEILNLRGGGKKRKPPTKGA